MTTEWALVVVALVWMGSLTVVVLVTARQVALLSLRQQRLSGGVARSGLPVGSPVPKAAREVLHESGAGRTYVLLTASTCGPCATLVPQLDRLPPVRMAALLPGQGRLADAMESLFPAWIRVIRDPEASHVAKSLDVDSTPFLFVIEDSVVAAKTYVHEIGDIKRLSRATDGNGRAKLARLEVASNDD